MVTLFGRLGEPGVPISRRFMQDNFRRGSCVLAILRNAPKESGPGMIGTGIRILGVSLAAGLLPVFAAGAGKGPIKAQPAAASEAPAVSRAETTSSDRMQVEEPEPGATGTDVSKAWQKNHAKGLTDAQKAAFRERKEKMEGLIAVIKAKRQAMHDANPEERAVLARELHSLILDKADDPAMTEGATPARIDGGGEPGAPSAAAPAPFPGQKDLPAAAPDVADKSKGPEMKSSREEFRQRQFERFRRPRRPLKSTPGGAPEGG